MSPIHPQPHHYFFILGLRLQLDSRPGGRPAWRISLEDPHTTERSGFKTLADLDAFLQTWMDERAEREGDAHGEMREHL